MNTMKDIVMIPSLGAEPELVAAVEAWTPSGQARPAVALEPRIEGVRVKLTYLGVESGVLFAWGGWGTRNSVQATLDRLYDVLSWRVVSPRHGS
ncbi:hypothetical protein SAMN05444166_0310 [Singulisphaera sp. GP187]|uniref:hypothetical protein n=1 Tax=Singulisphaera sp. GP187 TaxID=1882752 RepID=UPI00092A1ED1|nr:hypothetical protein [Singulisphaera sp. GP187]SIN70976.1 hypothetical protein SAMN05444166_0310 [Singulisphaera sp. GP187]